ncbi:MAG: hypothetical protein A2X94_11825 [Bdellovibrionales bacterium GWB1_55_8]|nr:MAG: hypothetical protein A2X94_11825 [Bdellovibrionales bacterium GWB1_55_8]
MAATSTGTDADIWVIFRLRQRLFGVSATHVREMALLTECAKVPKTGSTVRGVMNLRGQVLPVIDLRATLGMTTSVQERDEFIAMLNAREGEHQKWVAELEASVREKREFNLTTDPHKCAFGKWYDTFKTDNLLVTALLGKFDAPHKQIHALGVEVRGLVNKGELEKALHLIELTRTTTLRRMMDLFEEFRTLLNKTREIGLIVQTGTGTAALAVDSVESVEILAEVSQEGLDQISGTPSDGLIQMIGKRKEDQGIVMLLNPENAIQAIGEA